MAGDVPGTMSNQTTTKPNGWLAHSAVWLAVIGGLGVWYGALALSVTLAPFVVCAFPLGLVCATLFRSAFPLLSFLVGMGMTGSCVLFATAHMIMTSLGGAGASPGGKEAFVILMALPWIGTLAITVNLAVFGAGVAVVGTVGREFAYSLSLIGASAFAISFAAWCAWPFMRH